MLQFILKPSVLVVAFALVCPLAGGCSSDAGRDRAGKAVGGLQDTRDTVAAASKQVNEVLAATSALEAAPADLKPVYEKYKKEVVETEAAAKDARDRAQDMRERSTEYQAKWQEEMGKVTNPDLKAAAAARAAKVRTRYDAIQAKAEDTKVAYAPFIKDLKELQTYLSNDLTTPAIQAAKPVFTKVQSSGQVLVQKLGALQTELDDVATELSPAVPAK